MNTTKKLCFSSDYMEGCHPEILKRLGETNMVQTPGYGTDDYCESARDKIRLACHAPEAEIHFFVGGTQINAVVIDGLLARYEGVIAADTGHVSLHEAGAIEYCGHKVLTIPHQNGKITAAQVTDFMENFHNDLNHEHMVHPGMVYISHPTEYGTLYSKDELRALRECTEKYGLSLYVDGARLAYALACPTNDVTLADLCALTDAFSIGGTKCGALFGEACVFPKPNTVPHFFTIIKQHGALLAKGRILGIQFEAFFTHDLYEKIGRNAIVAADRIRRTLTEKGYTLAIPSPTNQIFVLLRNEQVTTLSEKIEMGFWETYDDTHTVMRIATSWATQEEDVDALLALL